MTLLMPRLDREAARELVTRHAEMGLDELAALLPDSSAPVTYSAVGGDRASDQDLLALRAEVVDLATSHGWPGRVEDLPAFESRCARLLHSRLPMTPHEAAHEDVWSCLTCCWLLDIALWRFGADGDERRFLGNVNRNTFRRLWWRAEILGPSIDLGLLGEDELVNIMERPTIAGDRRLARMIAREFLSRVETGGGERMQLMREAMKRLLRLTPFLAFSAVSDAELEALVSDTFDAALAAMNGRPHVAAARSLAVSPAPSPTVVQLPRVTGSATSASAGSGAAAETQPTNELAEVAIDIARRTGRVTNLTLREAAAISAEDAREIFNQLMAGGALVRRGAKRGTHYVLPDATEAPSPARQVNTALRRLLERSG